MKPNLKERKLQAIVKNRRASYEYHLSNETEAGIVLKGSEIKSIRNGKVSISEAYCAIIENELFIINMNISPYKEASNFNHEPKRRRKLLIRKTEIKKLRSKTEEKGNTIVPTVLYISERGHVKIGIALAKGKKLYDKREDSKEKDSKREIEKALKEL